MSFSERSNRGTTSPGFFNRFVPDIDSRGTRLKNREKQGCGPCEPVSKKDGSGAKPVEVIGRKPESNKPSRKNRRKTRDDLLRKALESGDYTATIIRILPGGNKAFIRVNFGGNTTNVRCVRRSGRYPWKTKGDHEVHIKK